MNSHLSRQKQAILPMAIGLMRQPPGHTALKQRPWRQYNVVRPEGGNCIYVLTIMVFRIL